MYQRITDNGKNKGLGQDVDSQRQRDKQDLTKPYGISPGQGFGEGTKGAVRSSYSLQLLANVAIRCSQCELRYAVNGKYISNFDDFLPNKTQ